MNFRIYRLLIIFWVLLFSSAAIAQQHDSQKDVVLSQAETQPEFPGGMMDFFNFLAKNTHYPAIDRQNKITGKVLVQFVIEKDGSLTDIKAVRGPSPTLMNEAVRVIGMSPKWKPGIQDGKPVRVMYTVPINFTLNAKVGLNKQPGKTLTIPDKNKVFTEVDAQPEFPGGVKKFYNFLAKNIHYPTIDRQKKVEGRVIVQFVVEKNGSLSTIKARRSPSETMAKEALRVMAASPKWKPGMQNGKPVRVMYTVPISFTLENKVGLNKQPGKSLTISGKNTVVEKTPHNTNIDIRGYPNIISDPSPLFVIDGVVRDKGSFDQLDPNAIESFSVLKDASATIYGAEANNGVILVTTRNLKKAADKKTSD